MHLTDRLSVGHLHAFDTNPGRSPYGSLPDTAEGHRIMRYTSQSAIPLTRPENLFRSNSDQI